MLKKMSLLTKILKKMYMYMCMYMYRCICVFQKFYFPNKHDNYNNHNSFQIMKKKRNSNITKG
jgi:hypothetical protein